MSMTGRGFAYSGFIFISLAVVSSLLPAAEMLDRPKSGPVERYPLAQVKPGMKATAWTVFEGNIPEPVPVEIVGVWKNAWGPKQDIIIGKMGGKAIRTNVAGGMSGSPVYIDGKLVGAVSLRLSVFSPDAICGITPIDSMLEVNEFDQTRPGDATGPQRAALHVPAEMMQQWVGAGASQTLPGSVPFMVPIEAPLMMSGFTTQTMEQFGPMMRQMGITPVQGGAAGSLIGSTPAAGWQTALQPGEAISQVMADGDMAMTAMCTVTYNDGKKVLACGHPVLNLGPVDMPIAKSDVLMTLPSAFQPNKFGNSTEIVGALRQDRHSAISGELGATAKLIPVDLHVRALGNAGAIVTEKKLHFGVFVDQKWTPFLMLLTVYNSISGMNEFSENTTYRVSGHLRVNGQPLTLSTLVAPADVAPMPTHLQMASWWGDKFSQLYLNSSELPQVDEVKLTVDLIPERRTAKVESAYLLTDHVSAGEELPIRVFLQPYRGDRVQQEIRLRMPRNLPAGEHRIVISDGDTLNRLRTSATRAERPSNAQQTVSLLQQERANNRLYVAIIEHGPTVFVNDQAMPNLPTTALGVLQSSRTGASAWPSLPETISEQQSIPFDYVISGSYVLRVRVE